MLDKLLKNKKLNSIIEDFYKKYKEDVLDIIVFGSSVRGKEKPKDLDILLLFKQKEKREIEYELRKKLEKEYPAVEVTSKSYENIGKKEFQAREAFLSEGFSLIKKENIAESLGFKTKVLFKYELKGWTQSKRMQFQYALYGRNRKSGMVKQLHLVKFADTMLLCPIEHTEACKEFLGYWKLNTEGINILIPKRLEM